MTLYLLFEQIERGRFRLDSPLTVSAYRRPPGARPSSVSAPARPSRSRTPSRRSSRSRPTTSPSTVAENIAGSEDDFAEHDDAQGAPARHEPHGLQNASGLPDARQVTTARDLVASAARMQDRFPRYYRYFSTANFVYDGRSYRNHNRLLGRVEGMDGIKTGYTRMSGFNLLTSVKTDGRHRGRRRARRPLGRRPRRPDGEPAQRQSRRAPMPAAARRPPSAKPPSGPPRRRRRRHPDRHRDPRLDAGHGRRCCARRRQEQVVARSAEPRREAPMPPLDLAAIRPVRASLAGTATPSGMHWTVGAQPTSRARPLCLRSRRRPTPNPKPSPKRRLPRSIRSRLLGSARAAAPAPEKPAISGWTIQLGASDNEAKAMAILENAKAKSARALGRAKPYTEKVVKDGDTLYRARFSGFQEADDAQAACKVLKRSGFSCFATRG